MAFRLPARKAPLVAGAAALVAAGVIFVPNWASAGAPDGKSSGAAALSCWAVKQDYPKSTTGLYWLKTPRMSSAQQFYCDMTTDGGGWILVGRGRENWNFHYAGQGSASSVRNTPTGTGAFSPATVPGDTINGLFNGGSIDEVRLHRAKNAEGSSWQDVSLKFKDLADWSWTFDGGLPLSSASFDGSSYSGGYTDTLKKSDVLHPYNGLSTVKAQSDSYKKGFAYTSSISGASTSASSYLWKGTSSGLPTPFTQVWIRPKITTSVGGPAPATPKLLSGKTSPSPWGVTGVVSGQSGENHIEVHALDVVGSTLYVGGEFEYVQKGANPAAGDKIKQSYLAAFDTSTGEWKSGFRPKLDGEVWSIKHSDDKLFVGGDFTNVNGQADTAGLAGLDLKTGAPLSTWKASLIRGGKDSDGKPLLPRGRAMDVQDGWLYIGGSFDHIKGGTTIAKSPFWVGNAARVKVTDGTPDTTWNPFFNTAVYSLDASSKGDRVYFGGRMKYMGKKQDVSINDFAIVSAAAPGDHISGLGDTKWIPSTDDPAKPYRNTILEVGDRVWMGGSEHDLQVYDRDFDKKIGGNLARSGGDFQSSVEINGVVYAGSHGFDFDYTDGWTYPDPKTGGYSNVHRLNMVGAWNAETGKYLPNWNPSFSSRAGNGVWALVKDNNGCMWAGGDLSQGSWTGSAYQWLGGFGRFCP